MPSTRSIGRAIARDIITRDQRRLTYHRLQSEAAARPGSVQVATPRGSVWMSPIEHGLYAAMRAEGLEPVPQYCIEGYYADFAFPDVHVAVEADGAAFHGEDRRPRDRKRDWVLRNAGWTVKRFHGSTIHERAGNCAYVVKREVEGRRAEIARGIHEEEMRRQALREAWIRPFRNFWRFLKRAPRSGT